MKILLAIASTCFSMLSALFAVADDENSNIDQAIKNTKQTIQNLKAEEMYIVKIYPALLYSEPEPPYLNGFTINNAGLGNAADVSVALPAEVYTVPQADTRLEEIDSELEQLQVALDVLKGFKTSQK